jgi:hypothetical protein
MNFDLAPIRTAAAIVAVEYAVGCGNPALLPSRIESLTGLGRADAERACAIGLELLRSVGTSSLRLPPGAVAALVRLLDHASPSGAAEWLRDVQARAGDASGTALGVFLADLARALDACSQRAQPPSPEPEPAPVPAAAPVKYGALVVDLEDVVEVEASAGVREPFTLTFDDESAETGGAAVGEAQLAISFDIDEGIAAPVNLDLGDAVEDDLGLSMDLDDLLEGDDSVDLDDDMMDDPPSGGRER